MKTASMQQNDRNNVSGQLDFVVKSRRRRGGPQAPRRPSARRLTRQTDRKIGDGVTDQKIRYEVKLIPETAVEARELVTATLAALDVPTTYQRLRTLVDVVKGQIRTATITENDRLNIKATLHIVVAKADEAALQQALADLGEVLTRSTERRPETDKVTNTKVEFQIELVSAASQIAPRKTITIQLSVDRVEERMDEFEKAVKAAGGRIVMGPKIEAEKTGGMAGEAIFDVPLSTADGLALQIRKKGSGDLFIQSVTENSTAPEGKLALARIRVVAMTTDLVPHGSGFDVQFRSAMSFVLRWLVWTASWLIAGAIFLAPWVILIWIVMWVLRCSGERRRRSRRPVRGQRLPPA